MTMMALVYHVKYTTKVFRNVIMLLIGAHRNYEIVCVSIAAYIFFTKNEGVFVLIPTQ